MMMMMIIVCVCFKIYLYHTFIIYQFSFQSHSPDVFILTAVTHLSLQPQLTCITPIVLTTANFVSAVHTISNEDRKCEATAINASFGQRLNQSIVQPLNSPGNFSERLRNFSPT